MGKGLKTGDVPKAKAVNESVNSAHKTLADLTLQDEEKGTIPERARKEPPGEV